MVIDIELSLAINLFINSLIIKLSALMLKTQAKLYFLSAFLGSAVAIILPLFVISWPLKLLLAVCVLILMECISFKFKNAKEFGIIFSVLTASTFLFGGGSYALTNLIGQMPLFAISIVSSAIYIIAKIIIKYQQKKFLLKKYTYNVILKDEDKVVYEEGYLDSGNVLYDTITKKPIILITFDVFHKFYSNINYINAFTKNYDKSKIKDGHFVRINNIGSNSNILVFRIDELQVGNDKCIKDALVGLTFSGFDKSFGRKVLLNSLVV